MSFITKIARSPCTQLLSKRALQIATPRMANSQHDLKNLNPNSYSLPDRQVNMEDLPEPYGPWKQAYEAESKRANIALVRGIVCFGAAIGVFYYSGLIDPLIMPNLDGLMDNAEPWNQNVEDPEDRISVMNVRS